MHDDQQIKPEHLSYFTARFDKLTGLFDNLLPEEEKKIIHLIRLELEMDDIRKACRNDEQARNDAELETRWINLSLQHLDTLNELLISRAGHS